MARVCVAVSIVTHVVVLAAASRAQIVNITLPIVARPLEFVAATTRAPLSVVAPPLARTITPEGAGERRVLPMAAPVVAPSGVRRERPIDWPFALMHQPGCGCVMGIGPPKLIVDVVPNYPKRAQLAAIRQSGARRSFGVALRADDFLRQRRQARADCRA